VHEDVGRVVGDSRSVYQTRAMRRSVFFYEDGLDGGLGSWGV
jgi:hypothetical protein